MVPPQHIQSNVVHERVVVGGNGVHIAGLLC
ncbi:MAG: hypothetical protein ACI9B9_000759 [Halioglobus sp.]|jgi:hypothetical protein